MRATWHTHLVCALLFRKLKFSWKIAQYTSHFNVLQRSTLDGVNQPTKDEDQSAEAL